MTYAVLDTETFGLNAQKFQLGCLWLEHWKKPEFYTNKKELWNRLIHLGKVEKRNRRKLYVYAHNSAYDFYSLGEMSTPGMEYTSMKPFIAKYKNLITFLDSKAIFNMDLASLGELTGVPKIKIDEWYYNTKYEDMNFFEQARLREYCQRDVEVVLNAIKWLKNKLKEDNIPFKTIFTINQIGINWIMSHLRRNNVRGLLDLTEQVPGSHKLKYGNHIREACRGGRNQAFQIGNFEHVDYIDINSFYWKCTMDMRVPDLTSETHHAITHQGLWKQDILSKFPIGNDVGNFKVEVKNGYHKNYGNKTYRINDTVHVGGARGKNSYISIEDFEKGVIDKNRMHSIKTNPELAGQFYTETENLKDRTSRHTSRLEKYYTEEFLYDKRSNVPEHILEKVLHKLKSHTNNS